MLFKLIDDNGIFTVDHVTIQSHKSTFSIKFYQFNKEIKSYSCELNEKHQLIELYNNIVDIVCQYENPTIKRDGLSFIIATKNIY